MTTQRIGISLPEELLEEVDRLADEHEVSRSEVFRRAVGEWLEREAEREAVRRYVDGYRRRPEDEEAIEQARRGAAVALAAEPWE